VIIVTDDDNVVDRNKATNDVECEGDDANDNHDDYDHSDDNTCFNYV
jgi:hypothetical protein